MKSYSSHFEKNRIKNLIGYIFMAYAIAFMAASIIDVLRLPAVPLLASQFNHWPFLGNPFFAFIIGYKLIYNKNTPEQVIHNG